MSLFFKEWISLDLRFCHRLDLSGMCTQWVYMWVFMCACVCVYNRERGPDPQYSSKRITLPLVAPCQPVRLAGCCLLLVRLRISGYLCALEMSEGFVLLLKQITNWSFSQGARLPNIAIHFCPTSKTPLSTPQVWTRGPWEIVTNGQKKNNLSRKSMEDPRCFRNWVSPL